MSPLLQFVLRRLISVPISLFLITLVIFAGVVWTTPAETRAMLYFPQTNAPLTEEQVQKIIDKIIERYRLDDPFPLQYAAWVSSLLGGDWGYSPTLNERVLPALLRRTPATVELAFYSALLFIPLGLLGGLFSGWKPHSPFDTGFRFLAFLSTSIPVFILALILISIFYIKLGWFAPERISTALAIYLPQQNFIPYTGMYTLDGLLNGRFDVTADAFRHLAMPVFALSLYHWATLGRIARAAILSERRREYITAARARGVNETRLLWRHAFMNMLAPSLTSLILSAASLVTGVFVVEIIFRYNGVSDVITRAMSGIPDVPAALGFTVYSVCIVLTLTFLLDLLQAMLDPRVRNEVIR